VEGAARELLHLGFGLLEVGVGEKEQGQLPLDVDQHQREPSAEGNIRGGPSDSGLGGAALVELRAAGSQLFGEPEQEFSRVVVPRAFSLFLRVPQQFLEGYFELFVLQGKGRLLSILGSHREEVLEPEVRVAADASRPKSEDCRLRGDLVEPAGVCCGEIGLYPSLFIFLFTGIVGVFNVVVAVFRMVDGQISFFYGEVTGGALGPIARGPARSLSRSCGLRGFLFTLGGLGSLGRFPRQVSIRRSFPCSFWGRFGFYFPPGIPLEAGPLASDFVGVRAIFGARGGGSGVSPSFLFRLVGRVPDGSGARGGFPGSSVSMVRAVGSLPDLIGVGGEKPFGLVTGVVGSSASTRPPKIAICGNL